MLKGNKVMEAAIKKILFSWSSYFRYLLSYKCLALNILKAKPCHFLYISLSNNIKQVSDYGPKAVIFVDGSIPDKAKSVMLLTVILNN